MFAAARNVGLQSDPYGALTLGRQYDAVVDYLGPLAMANNGDGNNLASHPFDNDNLDDSFYIDNAVKYTAPTLAGWQFGGLYGFSNAAGGFANNRAYSAGVSYANGPVSLGAAYLQLNRGGLTAGGALSTNDGPNFPAVRQRVMGAGGSYAFDRLTVGALWTHSMFDETAASSLPGALNALRFDNFEVNARYALTPAVSFAGAYTFTNGRYDDATGSHRPKWHQVTLMADYALSKRTDVYAETVYQHQFGVPAGATLGFANVTGPRLRRTTRRWSGRHPASVLTSRQPPKAGRRCNPAWTRAGRTGIIRGIRTRACETGTLGAGRAPDRHSAAGRCRLWNRDPMTTPIYQEIKDFILARIHAGEWAEGDQVPSENEPRANSTSRG